MYALENKMSRIRALNKKTHSGKDKPGGMDTLAFNS